ncbi:unnamed protein product [Chrysoparadoxa australica]
MMGSKDDVWDFGDSDEESDDTRRKRKVTPTKTKQSVNKTGSKAKTTAAKGGRKASRSSTLPTAAKAARRTVVNGSTWAESGSAIEKGINDKAAGNKAKGKTTGIGKRKGRNSDSTIVKDASKDEIIDAVTGEDADGRDEVEDNQDEDSDYGEPSIAAGKLATPTSRGKSAKTTAIVHSSASRKLMGKTKPQVKTKTKGMGKPAATAAAASAGGDVDTLEEAIVVESDRDSDSSNGRSRQVLTLSSPITEAEAKAKAKATGEKTASKRKEKRTQVSPGKASEEKPKPPKKRARAEQQPDMPVIVPAGIAKASKPSLLLHVQDEGYLELSKDSGAIGRMTVTDDGITFDLKGNQYDAELSTCPTMLVVGVGQTEAKVEHIFSEVCDLRLTGNVFASMSGHVLKGKLDASYAVQHGTQDEGLVGDGSDVDSKAVKGKGKGKGKQKASTKGKSKAKAK